jgi:hypothetical protein
VAACVADHADGCADRPCYCWRRSRRLRRCNRRTFLWPPRGPLRTHRRCNATPGRPGIEPLLIRLGVRDTVQRAGFLRYEGHWVRWGGPLRFMPLGQDAQGAWKGFQLWRPDFDAILLEGAMRAGTIIVRPCGELRPVVKDNRVAGVETPVGAWRSGFVVDATGRHSRAHSA